MKKLLVMLMLGCLVSCTSNLEQKKERTLTNTYENTIFAGVEDNGNIKLIQIDDLYFYKESIKEWSIPSSNINLIFRENDYSKKSGTLYEYSDYTYLYYSVNL